MKSVYNRILIGPYNTILIGPYNTILIYPYNKIIIVNYRFKEELFNGTLFETELVRDKSNNWFILIGDIYYYNGDILKDNYNIIDRMNIIYNILENNYIEDKYSDICPLQVKKYFDSGSKSELLKFINSLNYKSRGIYIVPINKSYSNILYMFKAIQ